MSQPQPGLPTAPAGLSVRIAWRLIPLLFTSYVVAYVDRINVGFAK
ncbi:MAG: MFS transporter, partial [Acidobacteria bacterium]|nr:MFS transporter [Acidobacteriota bacterium]